MKARSIFSVVSSRRWLVAGVVLVMLLLSPIWLRTINPTYIGTAEVAMVGNGLNSVLPVDDVPNLVTSTDVLERVAAMNRSRFSLDEIASATSAHTGKNSNVIPISVRSKNPDMAVTVANQVADVTVREYKALAQRQYDDLLSLLRRQLVAERATISSIDARMRAAMATDSSVGSQEGLEMYSKRLAELQSLRSQAYSTYVSDDANARSIQAAATAGGSPLGKVYREQTLAADPLYTAAKANQSKDVAEYISETAGYEDAFPGLAGLREKVSIESAAVKSLAEHSVREHEGSSSTYATMMTAASQAKAQAAGDLARVSSIDEQIADTDGRLSRLSIGANQLRLNRDSAANAMQILDARIQQTLADKSQNSAINSLVLLDHATAAVPRIPQPILATIVALVICGFAVGVAYLAEMLDPRIRTTTDVESLYGSARIG